MKRIVLSLFLVMATICVVSCTKDRPQKSDVKSVSVAEFIAEPESETQVYELVGTIGETINTTYGAFDLTDDTGTVYIYGLTATYLGYGSQNDKSFSSLDLNSNDRIRIRGYRGSFEDKVEMVYPWFVEKLPDGGSDTPAVDSETVETNSTAIAWASSTDDIYGKGFAASNNRLFVGYYKHTSTTTPVTANSDHIRIYKNSVIVVRGQSGERIKKIVFNCVSSDFCSDMTGLELLPDASADKSANTITWTGSAAKVVLQASKGPVRITKLTVEFE